MVENMPSKCKTEGCDKQAKAGGHCRAHGGGRRCQTEGCNKHDQGGGRCIAHGGGRRRKVGSPSIPEAPEGLSEDEEHHVDLVGGESEGEVVGTQVRYEGHHVDLVEGEGEDVDEVVGTQVRCVW